MSSQSPADVHQVFLGKGARLILQRQRQRRLPAVEKSEKRNYRDDLQNLVFGEMRLQGIKFSSFTAFSTRRKKT